MEKGVVVPEAVFQERYLRRYGACPNFSDPAGKIAVGGYMLRGEEIAEFLFSGNIYSPQLEDGPFHEVAFAIPKPRQQELYREIASMRKNQPIQTVFAVERRKNGSIREIAAFSRGKNESDLYVVSMLVGAGRRVTRVTYAFYETPPDFVSTAHPGNIVAIDSLRQRRMVLQQVPQSME